MTVLIWIVFGFFVGLVAKIVMLGRDPGGFIVFEQRASLARLERVLVVVDPEALICRQVLLFRVLAEGSEVLHLRVPIFLRRPF
jgi:hypothetical protein